MDNIGPLRQGGLPATTTFHVYKPEDALRGLDRALAVDYYLKEPAQKVTMEFLDSQARVIRTFTGTPADAERKPPVPGSGDEEGFRRPPDPHPAVAAGLHRLNWDMRYPGATEFPGLIMWAASRCASPQMVKPRRSRLRSGANRICSRTSAIRICRSSSISR
jgi:hypothetical protein